jgi:hypothetical protein
VQSAPEISWGIGVYRQSTTSPLLDEAYSLPRKLLGCIIGFKVNIY